MGRRIITAADGVGSSTAPVWLKPLIGLLGVFVVGIIGYTGWLWISVWGLSTVIWDGLAILLGIVLIISVISLLRSFLRWVSRSVFSKSGAPYDLEEEDSKARSDAEYSDYSPSYDDSDPADPATPDHLAEVGDHGDTTAPESRVDYDDHFAEADASEPREHQELKEHLWISWAANEWPGGRYEYLIFFNDGDESLDISGFIIEDPTGSQYQLPDIVLEPEQEIHLEQGDGEDDEWGLFVGEGSDAVDLYAELLLIYTPDGRLVNAVEGIKAGLEGERPPGRTTAGTATSEPVVASQIPPHSGQSSESPTPRDSFGGAPAGLPDTATERVLKTLPIEIITGWVAIQSLFSSNPQDISPPVYWAFFLLVLCFTFIFMARETSEESHPPTVDAIRSLSEDSVRLGQTILGVVSFVLWAFSLGEPFNFLSFYNGTIAGAVLVTYTIFLLPFFQGDKMYTRNRAAAV